MAQGGLEGQGKREPMIAPPQPDQDAGLLPVTGKTVAGGLD